MPLGSPNFLTCGREYHRLATYKTVRKHRNNIIINPPSSVNRIEVLKIVNNYVNRNMFFEVKEGSRTRGHNAALVKEQCRLDMRKYSFSQRVINEWNKLPNDCVSASSVNV